MNEFTIIFLNGITVYLEAIDWKDAILEAKLVAQRRQFHPKIKYIMDEDGSMIKDIDEQTLNFNYVKTELCQTSVKELG